MFSLLESLVWEQSKVKGDSPVVCAGQTFTSHHDKVIKSV